jgi:hypothetical protein
MVGRLLVKARNKEGDYSKKYWKTLLEEESKVR